MSEKDYAEFEEIKALTVPENIERHQLMMGQNTKYFSELAEEFEIDRELGLENQMNMDSREVLKKDIDELTDSKDFYEVNKKTLYDLFSIRNLRIKCLPYNIKTFISKSFYYFKVPLFYTALGIGNIVYIVTMWFYLYENFNEKVMTPFVIYNIIGMIGSFILSCFCLIKVLYTYTDKMEVSDSQIKNGNKIPIYKWTYQFMAVDLKMEPLNKTKMRIPRGAKLKTLEAQRTNIFENFVIAYPHVTIKNIEREVKIVTRTDPAILGVTKDNRMFMIVYWDIKKDIEKTLKNIDKLKKFKLNH